MKIQSKLLGLVIAIGVAIVGAEGCSGDDSSGNGGTNGADASTEASTNPPAGCAAGTKTCVNDSLAAVCPADGSGWLGIRCNEGEKCTNGACAADPNAACTPNDDTCTDDATALRCRVSRQGFDVVKCAAGATCQGKGECVGACVAGQSSCDGLHAVRTCSDGVQMTTTTCGAGELCVDIDGTHAACKPAACTPASCSDVCGNKNDAAADQTKFLSSCVSSPTGYRYEASACSLGQTCNPTGSGCGGGAAQAACAGDCTPGEMRCSNNGLGTQTCGSDGKWAAVTSCNANVAVAALVCMQKPGSSSQVICGDPICASGSPGTCVGDQFRACGLDGKLGTAAACTNGSCISTGGPSGAGVCEPQCLAGAERCTTNGSSSYQTCSNGRWASPVACAPLTDGAAVLCFDGLNPATGLGVHVCGGECTAGTSRCGALDDGAIGVQVCGNDSKWAAAAACSVGTCKSVGASAAACVADCVPNALSCSGSSKTSLGNASGTDEFTTCNANGTLGATTACSGDTVCRKNAGGQTISVGGNACLECVGPNIAGGNQNGLTDTRCAASAGDAGGTDSVQTCSANNVFVAGALEDCLAAGATCQGPIFNCNAHNRGAYNNGRNEGIAAPWYRTQSYYSAHTSRYGGGPPGCTGTNKGRGNLGAPVSCGAVPDCCGSQCNVSGPVQAACVP